LLLVVALAADQVGLIEVDRLSLERDQRAGILGLVAVVAPETPPPVIQHQIVVFIFQNAFLEVGRLVLVTIGAGIHVQILFARRHLERGDLVEPIATARRRWNRLPTVQRRL
jgi:hypothetical protein